jgi:hypothetical protein
LRFNPPQSLAVEQVGVDASGRLGKFRLRAELERAEEAEAGHGFASHALGEGSLAFRIDARVEG